MILEIVSGYSKYSHDNKRLEEHKKPPIYAEVLRVSSRVRHRQRIVTKPLLRLECLRRRLNVTSPTLNLYLSHIRLSLIIALLTDSFILIFKTHTVSLSALVSDSHRVKLIKAQV